MIDDRASHDAHQVGSIRQSSPPVSPPSPKRPRFAASLRRKTQVIVAATLVGLLAILYIPLRIFLLGSFASLEEQLVRTDVDRARSALYDDLHQVDIFNASFAIWDDTYAFVADPNPTYIEKNFYDQVFVDNQLSLALVVDDAGQVVFGKAFDLSAQREIPLPQRFQQLSSHDPLIANLTETNSITGVVLLPDAPMLIASHAIVTSEGAGPIRGALIMGRCLDAAEIQRLSANVHLALTLQYSSDPNLPADARVARAALSNGAPSFIQPLSEQAIAGYALIEDLDRQSILMLRVEALRSIYAQGQLGMLYFTSALLLTGLVFGALIMLLLERVVLRRLSRLNQQVQSVGIEKNLGGRVTVSGHDELADLGRAINEMLVALEHAQVERQRAEELREQMRRQEDAQRVKREFLGIVSHELRTPLTPIKGYVDLLLFDDADPLTPDQRRALIAVQSCATRMGVLVDDILEFGRIEAHKVVLRLASVDLSAVLAEVVRLQQLEIERRSLALTQEIEPDLPLVEADAMRIHQVFTNLLSNAIKYTSPEGWITLRLLRRDECSVEIQVEDSGIGMTPEEQRNLFVPFYRAQNPLSDQISGTGLGLAIAKAFVEMHHGTIQVRSEAGMGSTFTCTLPIRQPHAQDAKGGQ